MLLQPYLASSIRLFVWAGVLAVTVHAAPLVNQLESRATNEIHRYPLQVIFIANTITHTPVKIAMGQNINAQGAETLTREHVPNLCFGTTAILLFQSSKEDVQLLSSPQLENLSWHTLEQSMFVDLGNVVATYVSPAHVLNGALLGAFRNMFQGKPEMLLEATKKLLIEKKGAHKGADALSVYDGYEYISVVLIWMQLQDPHAETEFQKLGLLGDVTSGWIEMYKKGKALQERLTEYRCIIVIELLQGKYRESEFPSSLPFSKNA
ncbi:hypothetical protein F5880DRAFT_1509975 [Lentinula raphanica]|nr:hypothetical protein F5880DRAFT_1509975 [Lentinula raphanica]